MSETYDTTGRTRSGPDSFFAIMFTLILCMALVIIGYTVVEGIASSQTHVGYVVAATPTSGNSGVIQLKVQENNGYGKIFTHDVYCTTYVAGDNIQYYNDPFSGPTLTNMPRDCYA